MTTLQWQLGQDSARSYQDTIVPAYLGPAAAVVVERLRLQPGQSVLDVGCGTGAAAAVADAKVGPTGRVVGCDVNRFMVSAARSAHPDLLFREADARYLPFPQDSFDALVCAQTLQFIGERRQALREMLRVLRPGGVIGISTWRSLPENPYFEALAGALTQVFGADAATSLTMACTVPDGETVVGLLTGLGVPQARTEQVRIPVRLDDLAEFVPRHLASTPIAGLVRGAGDEAVAEVIDRVRRVLDPDRAGPVVVPFRTNVVTARAEPG